MTKPQRVRAGKQSGGPMKLAVTLHTTDFRGDHSASVTTAHAVRDGEAVEDLARRLITPSYGRYIDHIEIRVVNAPEEEAKS